MKKILVCLIVLLVISSFTLKTFTATKPTIYLCGDSTVMTYKASQAPQAGWGQFIANYFTTDVAFVNKAIGGRSTRTFYQEGRLDEILKVIQPNDYLFIQFGHNDASNNAARYTSPEDYKTYLKKYIDAAKAKNAEPVLITPVGRLNYKNNEFKNDFPTYCSAMKEVATEKNVKIIDLMSLSLAYYKSIGYDKTYKLFLVSANGTDYTHFTEAGAKEIAKIVADEIKKINLPLSKFVK